MHDSRCMHASHALHASVSTRIRKPGSEPLVQFTLSCPRQLTPGIAGGRGALHWPDRVRFRVPRAQPFAFTEFRSAGAVLRLSPRGDRMHPILPRPLRASTLRRRSPLPPASRSIRPAPRAPAMPCRYGRGADETDTDINRRRHDMGATSPPARTLPCLRAVTISIDSYVRCQVQRLTPGDHRLFT